MLHCVLQMKPPNCMVTYGMEEHDLETVMHLVQEATEGGLQPLYGRLPDTRIACFELLREDPASFDTQFIPKA